MTETNPENDVQDPAEPYRADKAVETQDQPEPSGEDVLVAKEPEEDAGSDDSAGS